MRNILLSIVIFSLILAGCSQQSAPAPSPSPQPTQPSAPPPVITPPPQITTAQPCLLTFELVKEHCTVKQETNLKFLSAFTCGVGVDRGNLPEQLLVILDISDWAEGIREASAYGGETTDMTDLGDDAWIARPSGQTSDDIYGGFSLYVKKNNKFYQFNIHREKDFENSVPAFCSIEQAKALAKEIIGD